MPRAAVSSVRHSMITRSRMASRTVNASCPVPISIFEFSQSSELERSCSRHSSASTASTAAPVLPRLSSLSSCPSSAAPEAPRSFSFCWTSPPASPRSASDFNGPPSPSTGLSHCARMSARRASPSPVGVPRDLSSRHDTELESLSTCDGERSLSVFSDVDKTVCSPKERGAMATRKKAGRSRSASPALAALFASTDPRDHVYAFFPGGREAVESAVHELSGLEEDRQAASYEARLLSRLERSQRRRRCGGEPRAFRSLAATTLGFLFLLLLYVLWLVDVQTETVLPVIRCIGRVLALPSSLLAFFRASTDSLSPFFAALSTSQSAAETPDARDLEAVAFPFIFENEEADADLASRRRVSFAQGREPRGFDGTRKNRERGEEGEEIAVLQPWMPLVNQLDDLLRGEGTPLEEVQQSEGTPDDLIFLPRLTRRRSAGQRVTASASRRQERGDSKPDDLRCDEGEPSEDWKAFSDLQRACAVPYGDEDAEFTLPQGAAGATPLVSIPRAFLLSSRNVPRSLRARCRVPSDSSPFRACTANELLSVLLIREKQLQRGVLRGFFATARSGSESAKDLRSSLRARLPPLPFCLLKNTKKNAFFFNDAHWEALQLLSLLQRAPLEEFVAGVTQAARASQTLTGDASEQQPEAEKRQREDVRDAVSILYSKGLWDLDGNIAVAPAGYELEGRFNRYTWNSDEAIMHEAAAASFAWKADRELPSGSQISVNQGQLSSVHTLHRFGVVEASNHWGPVFFFRRPENDQEARPRPPFASTRHANGISAPGELLFRASPENLQRLPSWMRRRRIVPRDGTMCFHPEYKAEQAHYGCPVIDAPATGGSPHEECDPLPELDRPKARETVTSAGQPALVCDPSVFFSRTFGLGSLVLRRGGPVGGFDRLSYLCLRELLASADSPRRRAPDDARAEEDEEEREEISLATKEAHVAGLLKEACFLQLDATQQAVRLLSEELTRGGGEETEGGQDAGAPLLDSLEAGETPEREREAAVTRMMLAAAKSDEELLRNCLTYFTKVEREAKNWARTSAEF
ncbi:hypothetical protein BESB_020790 [Besnoitia besnoiti]|uniref:Transmembrane protein n=1 Tax=Besnoitia besnoiti TaxID=94643 RepID=A0A2A9M0L4_BESBE|nr:hypothetical protein BESB_020790 [Besnoitia besnoiti]PFH32138.1 hypothetical protein BESB_020790 [Besnoitia besnoiti]